MVIIFCFLFIAISFFGCVESVAVCSGCDGITNYCNQIRAELNILTVSQNNPWPIDTIPIAGWTMLNPNCDDCNIVRPIGFSPVVFGVPRPAVGLSTNGVASFPNDNFIFNEDCFPYKYNNFIAMFYHDLQLESSFNTTPASGSFANIYEIITGTTPTRIRRYYYDAVQYGNPNQRVEFILSFFENAALLKAYEVVYRTLPSQFIGAIGEQQDPLQYSSLVNDCYQPFDFQPAPTNNFRSGTLVLATRPASPGACSPVTPCKQLPPNLALDFECAVPTLTSDRVCCPVSVCSQDVSYETTAPTNTTNRVCKLYTKCAQDHYETTAPTNTSDRVCSVNPYTTCNFKTQYEKVPPKFDQDRVCSAITFCNNQSYTVAPATVTADTQCGNLTVCIPPTVESSPPQPDADRKCSELGGAQVTATLLLLSAVIFNFFV